MSRRELIGPIPGDVRRDRKGQFDKQVDVGQAFAAYHRDAWSRPGQRCAERHRRAGLIHA